MSTSTSTKPENLFAALAAFQAELPRVVKTNTAKITSQRTGGTHTYDYADLPDVSSVIMPLLGRFGLAFTAKPTLIDGKFVLAYSLVHSSGEREDGIYPLTGGAPQELGAAITYARRYCLCAVTGVAADADDDGQTAQNAYQRQNGRQSATGAWDGATDTRPKGQVSRPANTAKAEETGELDADAQAFADRAAACKTVNELAVVVRDVMAAKKMNALVKSPRGGTGKLGALIDWHRKEVARAAQAKADESAQAADDTYAAVKTLADAGMVGQPDGAAA